MGPQPKKFLDSGNRNEIAEERVHAVAVELDCDIGSKVEDQ